MEKRRFWGIAALGAAAAALVVAPAASAQIDGTTYAASADGKALDLTVFGNSLTVGGAHSEADSTLKAAAEGNGILTPAGGAGAATASQEGEGTNGSAEEVCDSDALPEVPGLTLDLACGSALATVAGGQPSSSSSARVATIAVNPVGPLAETPLGDLITTLDTTIDTLLEGLDAVTDPVDDASGLGVGDTLQTLFDRLFAGADLVKITLGETSTFTGVEAGKLVSRCTSAGGRIDVLDAEAPVGDGALDPPPLASIIIGDATAQVTVSGGADPVATAEPAIVRVVVPTMGLDVAVEPDQIVDIPLPDPLTSQVRAAGAETGQTDDGQTFARASAVFLDLFNGEALMGGVELAIADCLAVAGSQAAPTPTPTTAAPTTTAAPILPRTGGNGLNGLAMGAATALAGLGVVLLRKSRASA